jgi:hypothetical protein
MAATTDSYQQPEPTTGDRMRPAGYGYDSYRHQPRATVGAPPPRVVKDRLDRGLGEMRKDAPKRRLCARFEKGDTYWYLTSKQVLTAQNTVTNPDGSGKLPWRIRNTYNFIKPIVQSKVSQATQRVPSYETSPTSTDPEDWGAAKLSERVALYGYDQWRVRGATVDTVKMAIAHGGEGFAEPYFDANVGPYIPVMDDSGPTYQGIGDIKVKTYSRNEVLWEPGCRFEDSRWWATEAGQADGGAPRARRLLRRPAGPGRLHHRRPDRPAHVGSDGGHDPLLRASVPVVSAGPVPVDRQRQGDLPGGALPAPGPGRLILDEPVLHRLVWDHDPDGDNDLGLVWQLVDFQRTAQDIYNKLLEYKNRGLHPQLLAAVNSLVRRYTDEPGAVIEFRGQTPPQWANPVQVPQALFQMLEQVLADMRAVAADVQIQADPNVAARTSQAVIENAQAQWQSFLGDLAEWHSRLMRHCLLLVARFYTEPRLIQIRGRNGPENIRDFKGAHLLGQVNVRVLPGSLENFTRQQITNQTLAFADRGWISPQQAMATINGGTTESLTASYYLDRAKVNRIIQKIRDGTVLDMPARIQDGPDGTPAARPGDGPAGGGSDVHAGAGRRQPRHLAAGVRGLVEDDGLREPRAADAGGREADPQSDQGLAGPGGAARRDASGAAGAGPGDAERIEAAAGGADAGSADAEHAQPAFPNQAPPT